MKERKERERGKDRKRERERKRWGGEGARDERELVRDCARA